MPEPMIKINFKDDTFVKVSKSDLEASLKPDVSKIKEGDEVWFRGFLDVGGYYTNWVPIAHFHQFEPKVETKVKMPEKYPDGVWNPEKKINQLIDVIHELRKDNASLSERLEKMEKR